MNYWEFKKYMEVLNAKFLSMAYFPVDNSFYIIENYQVPTHGNIHEHGISVIVEKDEESIPRISSSGFFDMEDYGW